MVRRKQRAIFGINIDRHARCAGIGQKLQQDRPEREGRPVPPSVATIRCGHPGFHLRPTVPDPSLPVVREVVQAPATLT